MNRTWVVISRSPSHPPLLSFLFFGGCMRTHSHVCCIFTGARLDPYLFHVHGISCTPRTCEQLILFTGDSTLKIVIKMGTAEGDNLSPLIPIPTKNVDKYVVHIRRICDSYLGFIMRYPHVFRWLTCNHSPTRSKRC